MTKVLLIVNPFAGKNTSDKLWRQLENELLQMNAEVEIRKSRFIHDATLIAKAEGAGFDVVCACGGDGTLSEVASGLMKLDEKERPALAFLPVGSTCDVARSFNLTSDPFDVCETILFGPSFAIDIGVIGGSEVSIRTDLPPGTAPDRLEYLPGHFIYVGSFGAFTKSSYATSRDLKKLLGHFAYILSGIRSISSIESSRVRIKRDDRISEESLIFGAILNARSIGGVLEISNTRFDDAKFELLLVRTPERVVQIGSMLNNLLNNGDDPLIVRELVSECQFNFLHEDISMTIDGEYGGNRKVWKFTNQARALNFKVPELPHPPSHPDTLRDNLI